MSHSYAIPVGCWLAAVLDTIGRLSPRTMAGLVLAAAGFALGLALTAEHWWGLLPCSLCLLERWPYRVAIGLGLLAVLAPRRVIVPLLWLIAIVLLMDAGLAVIHVGVEQHLWQNPISECAAPHIGGGSLLEQVLQLQSRPPMPCDRATYLVPFLPLSMAAMNAFYSAGCAALLILYLFARPGRAAR